MTSVRRGAFALATAGVVVIAGCGGDSEGGTVQPEVTVGSNYEVGVRKHLEEGNCRIVLELPPGAMDLRGEDASSAAAAKRAATHYNQQSTDSCPDPSIGIPMG